MLTPLSPTDQTGSRGGLRAPDRRLNGGCLAAGQGEQARLVAMGIAKETRQHGTRSTLDGLVIEVAGEGRPVLLLHGNSENHGYFAAQVPVLARHRRVLAPDARAHGESARGDGPLTIARLGQDAGCLCSPALGRNILFQGPGAPGSLVADG